MLRDQPIRASLRVATAAAHARVDAVFSRFDLGRRDGYGAFLQAQAAAFLPLEDALERGTAAQLVLDWPARRRAACLRRDLLDLGLPVPAATPLPPIMSEPAALGTLYVLEGSRLGGAVLRRSIPAEFPATFMAPAPSSLWRSFLEVLETLLTTAAQQSEAIAAAERAFSLFDASGQACLAQAA